MNTSDPFPQAEHTELDIGDDSFAAPTPADLGATAKAVDAAHLVARRQRELLAFVAVIVIALVALGIAPSVAVGTAFAAGAAAIELRRRGDSK